MVKVFSNNQEFNISKSLYESIIKNNPELLQEEFNISSENLDMLKHIFKEKFPEVEWSPDIEKKVLSMYIKSRQNSDVFKKALDDNRSTFVPEENSNNNANTNANDTSNDRRNDNLVGGYDPKEIAKKLVDDVVQDLTSRNFNEDSEDYKGKNAEINLAFKELKNEVKNDSKYGNKKKQILNYINQYIKQYVSTLANIDNKKTLSSLANSEEKIKDYYSISYVSNNEYDKRNEKIEQGKFNKEIFIDRFNEIIKNIVEKELKMDEYDEEQMQRDNLTYEEAIKDAKGVSQKIKSILNSYSNEKHNEIMNQILEIKFNTENNIFRYLTNNDFNKCIKTEEEITNEGNEIYNEIKIPLEKFMFDENESQRPKGMYELLKKVQENVKQWLIGALFQVKFSMKGGDRKPYFDNVMRQEFINAIKEANPDNKIYGIDVWKIFKGSDINQIWKNIITIDCRTQNAYQVVVQQFQKQSSSYNGGKIRVIPRSFPTAFKTSSMIYVIIENKREQEDNNIIPQISGNNIEIENALNKLKRVYFIFITEGMFRKGQLLSKIGKLGMDFYKNPEKYIGKTNNDRLV